VAGRRKACYAYVSAWTQRLQVDASEPDPYHGRMRRHPETLAGMLLAAVLSATSAHAGRRLLAWSYDTETLPSRGVELEQWVSESARGPGPDTYDVFWAVNIGLTNELEIDFPINWFWAAGSGVGAVLSDYGIGLKWRLVTSDPNASPAVVPLVRIGVKRILSGTERDHAAITADFVVTTEVADRVHLLLGANAELLTNDETEVYGSVLLGVSVSLSSEWRLGASGWWNEELNGDSAGEGWLSAGPDVSWTHGRFWLTGGLMIGVTDGPLGAPGVQGRVTWGVLF
jgi:hypothetical protein